MSLHRTAATVSALAFLLLASSPAGAQAAAAKKDPTAADLTLQDRILAVVDEDPILDSDVERVIRLGLAEPEVGEDGEVLEDEAIFRRRVLEGLIEQRLRFHAVDSFGFQQMPPEYVDRELEKLRSRYKDSKELERRMAAVGLEEEGLRQLLRRQLLVLTYIEERLGPRIFIRQEDIQAYYQDTLVPQLKASGAEVPPLPEVREQIRLVLREQRLNDEIEKWTRELREEAEVQVMADPPDGTLPPVVRRSEKPTRSG